MKRIIIVLHSLAVGGAERRLSTAANYMVEDGCDVTMLLIDKPTVKFDVDSRVKVVCVNQNPDLSEYDESKCGLFRLPYKPAPTFAEKLALKAYRKNDKKKAEILETELYLKYNNAVPLYEYIKQFPEANVASFMTVPNISLMMAAQKLPNRVLFGDCTMVYYEYSPKSPYSVLRRKYFGRADGAVFQTTEERDYYNWLPNVEKYVIPNFIRGSILPDRFVGKRNRNIVTFSRLGAEKDIPNLITAFEILHREYPEYNLHIFGEGSEKEHLLSLIHEKGLDDCAKIFDFDVHIHEKIKDSAMYVSSSYREGISNSMLEALATGLPCVCTDCAGGGARMMIEDGVNGILVPMKDSIALYEGMKRVIEDPALAESMSREAVKIKDRLEPKKICREMQHVIIGEEHI